MKEDHRSYRRNFCSCEKKSVKKFRLDLVFEVEFQSRVKQENCTRVKQ